MIHSIVPHVDVRHVRQDSDTTSDILNKVPAVFHPFDVHPDRTVSIGQTAPTIRMVDLGNLLRRAQHTRFENHTLMIDRWFNNIMKYVMQP